MPRRLVTPNRRSATKTRLDLLLDRVKPGAHEVTFDVRGCARADINRIVAAAKARGLNVAGGGGWLLVRDLRHMHRDGLPSTRPGAARRFGNANDPLVDVAQRASRLALGREMKAAIKTANKNLHAVLKPTYFASIPLDAIYAAVDKAGLTIPADERAVILCGRDSRARWPLTYQGLLVPAHLWISWHKMDSGRYEVIGAIT